MVYGSKKTINDGYRIISADETRNNIIKNVLIFNLNENNGLTSKIYSKRSRYIRK